MSALECSCTYCRRARGDDEIAPVAMPTLAEVFECVERLEAKIDGLRRFVFATTPKSKKKESK